MEDIAQVIRNYDRILSEVQERSSGKASLVLASKTVDQKVLKELAAARPGIIFGENKVQELLSKFFVGVGTRFPFTIKGKGIKKLKGSGSGNLVVTVNVEMPKTLDKSTREKIEDAVKGLSNSNYTKCKDYESKLSKL